MNGVRPRVGTFVVQLFNPSPLLIATMDGLGLGLTGSAKPLLVRPVQLEPPKLPTLPTAQGRPSLTSPSLNMDVRGVAATRPLLIFSATGTSHHGAGRPVYGDDATGSSSSLLLHFGVSYKFYLFQIIY